MKPSSQNATNVKRKSFEDVPTKETTATSNGKKLNLVSKIRETQRNLIENTFYNQSRQGKGYATRLKNGDFLSLDKADILRRFREVDIKTRPPEGEIVSAADRHLTAIQDNRAVSYMGSLAGYKIGLQDFAGFKALVTREAKLIEPVEGEWPLLETVFRGLSGMPMQRQSLEQFNTLNGWVKRAYLSLRDGRMDAGQALVIAGEANAGKSLLTMITREILGGRFADASRYMQGKTDFNLDLCQSEVLILDDKAMSTRINDRNKFGEMIKSHTVSNHAVSVHGKGVDAFNVPLFWRIIIAVNDSPEKLQVLPPLNEDIADKMILFKGHCFEMPMDTSAPEGREKFWNALMDELPHYIHWLLHEFELHEKLIDSRYGVRTFHNNAIRDALNKLSPEMKLLELIDQVIFDEATGIDNWEGLARDLQQLLSMDKNVGNEVSKLLLHSNTCGKYLGRLSDKAPERVERHPAKVSPERWILKRG